MSEPIKEVPKEVKSSQFGCPNCLWAGIECKQGSKYTEKINNGKKSCAYYTYYD